MKCEEIKCILRTMMHNVTEAREKINKAYEWQGKHRGIGDWFKQMAASHLEFNASAMQLARSGLQEMRSEHAHGSDQVAAHHNIGKCEAYEEWLEQIGPEMAEVKAMIDGYGK